MELMELAGFLVSALFCAKITDALFYFFAHSSTEEARVNAVGTSFFAAALLGAVAALAGWMAAEPVSRLVFGNARFASYFRITFFNFAFLFPQEVGFGYLRLLNRSGAYVTRQLAS